jgi:hypothetical protein
MGRPWWNFNLNGRKAKLCSVWNTTQTCGRVRKSFVFERDVTVFQVEHSRAFGPAAVEMQSKCRPIGFNFNHNAARGGCTEFRRCNRQSIRHILRTALLLQKNQWDA